MSGLLSFIVGPIQNEHLPKQVIANTLKFAATHGLAQVHFGKWLQHGSPLLRPIQPCHGSCSEETQITMNRFRGPLLM